MSFSLVGGTAWVITTVLMWIGLTGLFGLMAVESFGIPPLPSEVILTFSGFLVAEGTFPLYPTIFVALAGGLVGAYIAYAVGRWGRTWITQPRPAGLRLDPAQLDRVDRWFRGRDEWIVAVTRMIPVVRSYISYPAGFSRMNPARFGLYTLLGTAPFTIGLIYAGIVLQSDWSVITGWFDVLDYIVVALLILGAVYLLLVWRGYVTWGWPPHRVRGDSAPVSADPPVEP